MAVTRLVRKALRNRAVSSQRVNNIKRLTSKPVIKNVDIEQIKEEFASKKATQVTKKEAPVKEEAKAVKEVVDTPKAETKVAKPEVEAPAPKAKAEKKETSTKASAKKESPKAKKEEAAPDPEKKEKSE